MNKIIKNIVLLLVCTAVLSPFLTSRAFAGSRSLRSAGDILRYSEQSERSSPLEQCIIQTVDPVDFESWADKTKIDYIYSEEGLLSGWYYSSALDDGEWDEPYKKVTIERQATGLIATLTYSVYEPANDVWQDEVRFIQEYDDSDRIDYLFVEHYDRTEGVWVKEAFADFNYALELNSIIIAARLDGEESQDYEFQRIRFHYDLPEKRVRTVLFQDDIDDNQSSYKRRNISYHKSDTGTYQDFLNFINNLSLYLDKDALWTMEDYLSGFEPVNIDKVYDYESVAPDRWGFRYKQRNRYDENNNLASINMHRFYPPGPHNNHIWLGEQRYIFAKNQQGNISSIIEHNYEPYTAIMAIRKAYDDYREEHGTVEGYGITQAIKDADISELVRSYWTFETVGNPPTQYIATSTTSIPVGDGHQVVYDVINNRFSGLGINYFPKGQTEIEELWVNSHRLLFTYQGETSVEDSFLSPQSLTLSNHPNPFNPETTITFVLPVDVDNLQLKIYNVRGQHIRTLIDGVPQSGGESQIVWDGKDERGRESGSGLYFYRLTTDKHDITEKMLLVK